MINIYVGYPGFSGYSGDSGYSGPWITTYPLGQNPTPIAPIYISDDSSATMASATTQFSSGYNSGQDILLFNNSANITYSWNTSTGTLSFSGTDLLMNYQQVLSSLAYINTYGSSGASGTRTLSYQVNDGTTESNSPLEHNGVNYSWTVNTGHNPSLPVYPYYSLTVTLKYESGLPASTINNGDNCRLFWNI